MTRDKFPLKRYKELVRGYYQELSRCTPADTLNYCYSQLKQESRQQEGQLILTASFITENKKQPLITAMRLASSILGRSLHDEQLFRVVLVTSDTDVPCLRCLALSGVRSAGIMYNYHTKMTALRFLRYLGIGEKKILQLLGNNWRTASYNLTRGMFVLGIPDPGHTGSSPRISSLIRSHQFSSQNTKELQENIHNPSRPFSTEEVLHDFFRIRRD